MRKRFALAALAAGLVAAVALTIAAVGGAVPIPLVYSSSPSPAIAVVHPNTGGLAFVTNKGFASVSSPGAGIYCLLANDSSNVKPNKRPALLTIVADLTTGDGVPSWRTDSSSCPTNKYYEVVTYDSDTLASVDNVGFLIVVN